LAEAASVNSTDAAFMGFCIDRFRNKFRTEHSGLVLPDHDPNRARLVTPKSGVLAPESSGNQIDLCYLNTVFELYSSYHLGQVNEAA